VLAAGALYASLAAPAISRTTCCGSPPTGSPTVVQVVFDGSGTATSTATDQSGGSSTDTDSFSWHAVYQVPLSDLSQYASGSSGWNDTGIHEDYAASTFSGTTNRSCSAPSGGTCAEPGGGTTCQGSFTNNNNVPLSLLALSPGDNNVFTVAAPAYSANQPANNCFPAAIEDTCDPLYAGPYPGQGENTPVVAQFKLDASNPQTAQPIPVSTNQSWSCTSSGGQSGDTGSIQWTGTVMIGCSGTATTAMTAAAGQGASCCKPLTVTVTPSTTAVYGRHPAPLSLTAKAAGGCPKYSYAWKRATQPASAAVTPARAFSKGVRVVFGCTGAAKTCYGQVSYRVTVTDSSKSKKSADVFIRWCADSTKTLPTGQPCTNPMSAKDYKDLFEQIKNLENKQGFFGVAVLLTEAAVHAAPALVPPLEPLVLPTSGALAVHDVAEFRAQRAELATDLKLFLTDPPDRATSDVALPVPAPSSPPLGCLPVPARYAAQAAHACAVAGPLYNDLLRATQQTGGILGAMVSTANRFATALRDNQRAAVPLQQATTAVLAVELADALTTERAAGIELANALDALGLAPTLSRGRLERIVTALRHMRTFPDGIGTAVGVGPAQLAEILQTELVQTRGDRFDLLATLSAPEDTTALIGPDATVTPTSVQSIVDALLSQGAISSQDATALGEALSSLASASGGTTTNQALAQFSRAAQQVPGSAGLFLEAAEHALAVTE
jgi:hypothetical protein